MIEIDDAPDLVDPVVIAAFEGWNDAADAASSVVDHLIEVWDARIVGGDRPRGVLRLPGQPAGGRHRRARPPPAHLAEHPDRVASPPDLDRDVILRARASSRTCAGASSAPSCSPRATSSAASWSSRSGALLADTPHTRPIPVTGTATEPELVDRLKLEQSTYEGPTGIVGVFQDACVRLDIPAVSYWAAVPHYVAQPPCPKATLALLGQLEDLLEVSIPLGDLPEDARAWERGVDELAEEDEDVADYVRALEETRDTTDLPEASGEAIAREFERYLKRRDDEPEPG